jgi:putative transposase
VTIYIALLACAKPSWNGLKKSLGHDVSALRARIDRDHALIPIVRQAELLGLSRASVYRVPAPLSHEERMLLDALDQEYTDHPFLGARRLVLALEAQGFSVGRKKVRTLMHLLGIEAVYPRENTSKPNQLHRVFPYLLSNRVAAYPNHVWGTDITYIRLSGRFCYLVALLDWFSRYVVAWTLSPTLEIEFCLDNLERALKSASPAIHNSDQGSHFTSPQYTNLLLAKDIAVSMDGRGRCMDNIFTERLWRTVKYEDVYIKGYASIEEAQSGLAEYFRFYNEERPHQSLGYQTPASVYFKTK